MHISNEAIFESIDGDDSTTPSTKQAYRKRLERLLRVTNAPNIFTLLMSPGEYNDKIKSGVVNAQSRVNLYVAIITVMSLTGLKESQRAKYNEWYGLMMKEKDAITKRVNGNIPTERQVEAHIEWDGILKVRDSLKIGSIDHVLVGIYTFIPPRRVKDYATMRVYNDPTYTPVRNHTYIHLNHNKRPHMYIHEFKTVKFLNPYFTTELPKALLETISVSLRSEPRQYLFCQESGEPFKNELTFSSFVNRRLKDIFKNSKFTVTSFRHSYATYMYNKGADLTVGERVKDARAMGHGLVKHLSYAYARGSLNQVTSDSVPNDDVLCYEKDKSSGKMKAINCMELTRRLQARAKQLKAAKTKEVAKPR